MSNRMWFSIAIAISCVLAGTYFIVGSTGFDLERVETPEHVTPLPSGAQPRSASGRLNSGIGSPKNSIDPRDALNSSQHLYDVYFENYKSNIPAQSMMARRALDYCIAVHLAGRDASIPGGTNSINNEALMKMKGRCTEFDLGDKSKINQLRAMIAKDGTKEEYYEENGMSEAALLRLLEMRNPVVLYEAADAIALDSARRQGKVVEREDLDYRKAGFEGALCFEGLKCDSNSNLTLLAALYAGSSLDVNSASFLKLQEEAIARQKGDIGRYRNMREAMRPVIRRLLDNGDTMQFLKELSAVTGA